jgi:hypothetical protein
VQHVIIVMLWMMMRCVWRHASDNDIGDEGATALASALKRNSTLQQLDVGGECHRDVGVCRVTLWLIAQCDRVRY